MPGKQLIVRLEIVWSNDNAKHRYIPRSLDGGRGWGVWDKATSRFLSDKEVVAIPKKNLQKFGHINERVPIRCTFRCTQFWPDHLTH